MKFRAARLPPFAAVLFLVPGVVSAAGAPEQIIQSHCRLDPKTLDVGRVAGPLVARVELFSADGLGAIQPARLAPGVYVSSVAGMRLPGREEGSEGIDESPGARLVEDRAGVRGGGHLPNGVPEAVVRFVRPCDGKAETRDDGDASDVLAMLMDVPDGGTVEVCIAGRVDEVPFECCDAISVRNRGLRDRPHGLIPATGHGRP